MLTPIVGTGTAEPQWQTWPHTIIWPALQPLDRPLVVAPHPHDDILGIGGLLATVGDAEVVAVTDGEQSHPHSTVYRPEQLAAIHRAETTEALRRLGIGDAVVHRLGHRDGNIDEQALTGTLTTLLTPGRRCLTTWRGDGHPDHEAAGRAAAVACADTGAVLLEYPVWMWHWARPDDERVPWQRTRRVDLSASARSVKADAIAALRSQIAALGPGPADGPNLPPAVLERFARPFEVVFA